MSSLQEGPESCPVTLTAHVNWGKARPSLARTNQKLSALPTADLFAWCSSCSPCFVPTQRGALGAVAWPPWPLTLPCNITQVKDQLFSAGVSHALSHTKAGLQGIVLHTPRRAGYSGRRGAGMRAHAQPPWSPLWPTLCSLELSSALTAGSLGSTSGQSVPFEQATGLGHSILRLASPRPPAPESQMPGGKDQATTPGI